MIILIGLVILVAAVVIGVAGVLANGGQAHAVGDHFAVFGHHFTGSTGTLLLYGIIVGAAGVCGLNLLLTGARRTARRGRSARRELEQSRRETATASHDRDELIEQRDALASSTAAHADGSGSPGLSDQHDYRDVVGSSSAMNGTSRTSAPSSTP